MSSAWSFASFEPEALARRSVAATNGWVFASLG